MHSCTPPPSSTNSNRHISPHSEQVVEVSRRNSSNHPQGSNRSASNPRPIPSGHQSCTHHQSKPYYMKASKTELTTGLSLKTNVSDVSKTVEELSDEL